jgi:hypothetical protein
VTQETGKNMDTQDTQDTNPLSLRMDLFQPLQSDLYFVIQALIMMAALTTKQDKANGNYRSASRHLYSSSVGEAERRVFEGLRLLALRGDSTGRHAQSLLNALNVAYAHVASEESSYPTDLIHLADQVGVRQLK